MEKIKKQGLDWKPHIQNLLTWAFIKVNNNQPIDIHSNQIMR
jgi:hypothetical protein